MCIVQYHDECENAMIIDEVLRLSGAIGHWTFGIYYPNEMNVSEETCRLRAIMEEVQRLASTIQDQNFTKCVENSLERCSNWSQLFEEMEQLFGEVNQFRQELLQYLENKPTPQLTVTRFKQSEESFGRLSASFAQLEEYVDSDTILRMVKLRSLLGSMYLKSLATVETTENQRPTS